MLCGVDQLGRQFKISETQSLAEPRNDHCGCMCSALLVVSLCVAPPPPAPCCIPEVHVVHRKRSAVLGGASVHGHRAKVHCVCDKIGGARLATGLGTGDKWLWHVRSPPVTSTLMGGVCVHVQVTGRGYFYSPAQSYRLDFALQQQG